MNFRLKTIDGVVYSSHPTGDGKWSDWVVCHLFNKENKE